MNSSNIEQTAGNPEITSLIVKMLDEKWIVENGLGESIGEAADRDSAVRIAREEAESQRASAISVLKADGSVGEVIEV